MSIRRRLFRLIEANLRHMTREREDTPPEGPRFADREYDRWPRGTPPGSEAGQRSATPAGDGALHKAYRLLELPPEANAAQVRDAHRRLLIRYHPDLFARDDALQRDATRLSQELTAARDLILKELARRGPR